MSYVDDFKMAVPSEAAPELWAELKKLIGMEEPKEPSRFLGCYARPFHQVGGRGGR